MGQMKVLGPSAVVVNWLAIKSGHLPAYFRVEDSAKKRKKRVFSGGGASAKISDYFQGRHGIHGAWGQ